MSRARPFLGETTDRDRAFHGIKSFELSVIQDRFGHHTREPWQRESRYTKMDIPRFLACANPRCQQGGLDLQQIVNFWPSGERTVHCGGHEGTPQGRRRGDPCDNSFVVTLRKPEEN